MRKGVIIALVLVAAAWFIDGMIPIAFAWSPVKVGYNTCYGNMLAARLACLMYRDDLGVYPGQIDDIVRELDLSHPGIFLCPKSKREGRNLRFDYDRPTAESEQTHVLFRTTRGDYVKDGKRGNVGVRLNGQMVLLPDE